MERSGTLRWRGNSSWARVLVLAALVATLVTAGNAEASSPTNDSGFLRVSAPDVVRKGAARVVIRTKQRPEFFSARLKNVGRQGKGGGRDLSDELLRHDGIPRRSTISASEGLRRGRNRLTITANRGDRRDSETRSIVVKGGPIPAAGRDVEVEPGDRVRLDGSRSLARHPGGPLDYRWTIVRQPKDSEPRLRRRHSGRPVLLTDTRGIYRVALEVGKQGQGGSASRSPRRTLVSTTDKLEVGATQNLPIGQPLSTLDQQDGVYGITVDGTFYPSPDANSPQLLIFNRNTMELRNNLILDPDDSQEQISELVCDTEDVVLLQVPPPADPESFVEGGLAGEISCLPTPPPGASFADGISSIRAPSQTTNWSGPMSGYFQDHAVTSTRSDGTSVTTDWYRYVPGEYVEYDSQAPDPPSNGNTISIGGLNQPTSQTDQQQLPTGASGFHAVAIDADSLEITESRVFPTNGLGDDSDAEGIALLADWLAALSGRPETDVVLQSIGAPDAASTPNPTAWADAAKAIAELGGNSHVFNTIDGSYALLGSARFLGESGGAHEASSVLTGRPAQAQGMLSRDSFYRFAPRVRDPSGAMDLSLMPIAYQRPSDWPYPDGPGQTNAADYLAQQIQGEHLSSVADMREAYWSDGTFASQAAVYAGQLECDHVPDESGFSAADYNAVCKPLQAELNWVGNVQTLIGAPGDDNGELQKPFVDPDTQQITDTISNRITEQLEYDPGTSGGEADVLAWVSDLAWALSELDLEDGISVEGLSAAGFAVGSDAQSTLDGGSATDPIKADADKVVDEFLDQTATNVRAFGELTQIIVSDYSKLSTVGQLADKGGAWQWETGPPPLRDDATNATNAFVDGSVRWAYRELLPVKYRAVVLAPDIIVGNGHNVKPEDWDCVNQSGIGEPFYDDPPPESYFDHYVAPNTPDAYWIMGARADGAPPSSDLAEALHESGLYLEWLSEDLGVMNFSVFWC